MAINLLTPALNVYQQMALDEVLARSLQEEAVLRFYHWTAQPAVTFGYAQFYDFVKKQCLRETVLCRRPTGGGIVFHGEDLTFSLVFHSSTANPREIYARLHEAMEQGLLEQAGIKSTRQASVVAQAYAPAQNGAATGCFVSPVTDDLLMEGKKILGGAIRRFGSKVLYQGSLQCPQARTNPLYRRAISRAVEKALQIQFQTVPVAAEVLLQMQNLAQSQYTAVEWNQKF